MPWSLEAGITHTGGDCVWEDGTVRQLEGREGGRERVVGAQGGYTALPAA